ncbi:glycerate kinase [Ferrimonas senticii]|uniref:glycerate kinase n=1 Tax=Ferrimonas senticii TaxID=394566 RepID=UPI0003FEFC48|nr:glycerate kinase [Ferrimonas senticii]
MKIVIAPDSFKETLTALEVASHIETGIRRVLADAEIIKLPAADGGEGTVEAMVAATGGEFKQATVTGPLGQSVSARFALLGDGSSAIIEMAEASGLHLVPPTQRDPRITCSYGTGELIKAALDCGISTLLLGLGGSATNDGGAGMLRALGVKLLDHNGNSLSGGGAELARLASIDISELDPRLTQIQVQVACDVNNPLCGERGASAIFGPQKGATPKMVAELDNALQHFGNVIEQQLGKSVLNTPGAGAAGGMGAAALAFLSATMRPGVELVMDAIGIDEVLKGADLVITGEGRMDAQTIAGKTPIGVAKRAKAQQIPVIAIAGCLREDAHVVLDHGIDAIFDCVTGSMDFEQIKRLSASNLAQMAENIMRVWQLASNAL